MGRRLGEAGLWYDIFGSAELELESFSCFLPQAFSESLRDEEHHGCFHGKVETKHFLPG